MTCDVRHVTCLRGSNAGSSGSRRNHITCTVPITPTSQPCKHTRAHICTLRHKQTDRHTHTHLRPQRPPRHHQTPRHERQNCDAQPPMQQQEPASTILKPHLACNFVHIPLQGRMGLMHTQRHRRVVYAHRCTVHHHATHAVKGLGVGVWGLGFGVWSSMFRDWSLGIGSWGLLKSRT